jgi:hypothetical protein
VNPPAMDSHPLSAGLPSPKRVLSLFFFMRLEAPAVPLRP